MNRSNLRQVNLNALPILREILWHQNITKAAESLHLTPPALSNSLRQLREYFNDDLIVRQGRQMVLTPKAQRLFEPLDDALMALQNLLSETEFSAAESPLQFEIAMTDQAKALLLPNFLARLSTEAPKMQPQIVTITRLLATEFFAGRTNLIIGPRLTVESGHFTTTMLERLHTYSLWIEPLVCIGRDDDLEIANGLTVDEYLARPHMVFDLGPDLRLRLEQAHLSRIDVRQNNKLHLTGYNLMPELVCASGYLALVPLSVALAGQKTHAIRYVEPPIAFPPFEMVLSWRDSDEHHMGLKWIREAVIRCADNLMWQSAEGNDVSTIAAFN